ncbi:hypothetical protein [Streptomyces sioyaensis]|uniref:hypothetical protein n=1 Tax=Streptomyces sioyaensis TaxID=67364 RepID=UPI0037BE0715
MRSGVVHLLPSPVDSLLGGRELSTDPGPWVGDCPTAGDADWGLYVPVHRGPVTGVVLAEVRPTVPRRW